MHTGKVLVGNSGDRVYLQDNKVIKEAGVYPIKFKQQMDWLKNCTHPNFIKINPISDTSFEMKRYPTWYDKICEQPLIKSIDQLDNLILPLSLRLFKIFRPFLLLNLTRKPCLLFLLTNEG